MARRAFDEYVKVTWATSIASISAPTTTELNAGTDLTTFVKKDGIKRPATNNKVKTADVSTSFDSEIPGSYGVDLSLMCFRDDTTDTAWTALKTRNTAGFLVIRTLIAYTTAYASSQKVEVYPATTLQPTLQDSAENTVQAFLAQFAVTSTPQLAATIA